jgi:uncharacterized SAM-binding protein YcdF (DUF218 family)
VIYLHKILPFFVLPLGLTFILVAAGVVFRRRLFLVAGLALLWFSAMPVTSELIMRAVEGWEVRQSAEAMPEAGAIVVLSSKRVLAPGDPPVSEWDDPDRFFGGIELYKAGRAPLIIFTGGWVPWGPGMEPEGQVMIRYAMDMGVSKEHLLTTDKASNTEAEALAVAELLRKREGLGTPPRILLVTSAFHMRRARLLFERAGLEVIPFRVDFQVSEGGKLTILDFMPRCNSLCQTETALREVYGYVYYRLKAEKLKAQS